MKILITGAGGFLGAVLAARCRAAFPQAHLVLLDRYQPALAGESVDCIAGDITDPAVRDALIAGTDVLYHLAALPGGAAEADYEASVRINLNGSLALFERAAREPRPVRVVYASSIAVYGEPMPSVIDDDTAARPTMTYGTHKLMACLALENLSRLGRVDGLALHLPGLVARPRAGAGFRSAFMSDVFHAMAAGENYTMPTRPEATAWFMSLGCCVDNLLRASQVRLTSGARRVLPLPVIRASMHELVAALAQCTGTDAGRVRYQPDAGLEGQFARLPPQSARLAESLGFQHDGSLTALVRRALADAGYSLT